MKDLSGAEATQTLEVIRRVWRSALGTQRVIYLSGPITTGKRFIEWYERAGSRLSVESKAYKEALRTEVILPNERDLQQAAELLRARDGEPVIEPASLFVMRWKQSDYVELWERFIADHASTIVLMPGWQYSAGCAAEYCRAHLEGIPTASIDGTPIVVRDAAAALQKAIAELESMLRPPQSLLTSLRNAGQKLGGRAARATIISANSVRKDQSLDQLAEQINVAQFVSFEPVRHHPRQVFSRVLGEAANTHFKSTTHAAEVLLERSADSSVNIRSFTPESPQGREFIYGLKSVDEIVSGVERLTRGGLNTIINETVDINDGGISGVLLGNVLEFAPDDTPRAVEKAGIASLPRGWGLRLLASVYGFEPNLAVPTNSRLEFSIHPKPRGWRHTHTLGWEIAEVDRLDLPPLLQWPNRFSRMIGDKVFGLLVAHHIGLLIPRTTVVNRRVAPFTFGQPTGSSDVWFRTSPSEQVPGKFTTSHGWKDPFKVLESEDPEHVAIASVIAQAAIDAKFSGASIVLRSGEIFTEGVQGAGNMFMLGAARPDRLPASVLVAAEEVHARCAELGAVRFEWVHDGQRMWVVQLHQGSTASDRSTLVEGEPDEWLSFDTSKGLPALRQLLATMKTGSGLLLLGDVGLTSHIADIIRKAQVPARIAAMQQEQAAQ